MLKEQVTADYEGASRTDVNYRDFKVPLTSQFFPLNLSVSLQRKIISKWHQKPTRPILRYCSVVNKEKDNFTNFENSCKINENSY